MNHEENKLIAEFLGWEYSPNVYDVWTPDWNCPFSNKIPTTCPYTEGLYFNESWDWLMPVVDKIEKEIFDHLLEIKDESEFYYKTDWGKFQWSTHKPYNSLIYITVDEQDVLIISHNANTRIESVWLTVIDYINWKNKNESRSN